MKLKIEIEVTEQARRKLITMIRDGKDIILSTELTGNSNTPKNPYGVLGCVAESVPSSPAKPDWTEHEVLERDSLHNDIISEKINIKRLKRKKKNKVKISEDIMPIIEAWEINGLSKMRKGSERFRRIIDKLNRLIEGNYFLSAMKNDTFVRKYIGRKIPSEKIILAIERLASAIKDPLSSVSEKRRRFLKKMSLEKFIFNPRSGVSNLLMYMERPETKVEKKIDEDKFPEATAYLRRFFLREVVGREDCALDGLQENHFRKASKRLNEYYNKNKHRFALPIRMKDMPKMLCDAIVRKMDGRMEKITPFRFCSDYTFDIILPAYLKGQGVFMTSRIMTEE